MPGPVKGISTLSAQERRAFLAELLTGRAQEHKSAPVSFAQERMWFIDQLQPGSSAYNLIDNQRMHGPLDVLALERSINAIVKRHEILRTIFVSAEGRPAQWVLPALTIPLNVVDLRALPAAQIASDVRRLVEQEARRCVDLAKGPLIRTTLLRLADEDHLFLLSLHHIVSDEEVLAGIWQEVLGLDRVGVHDNFFELGGHSLLINRLTARIAQIFEIEVPVRRLFEVPTVAEFAVAILDGSSERRRLEHVAETLLAVVRMEDTEVELRLAHVPPPTVDRA